MKIKGWKNFWPADYRELDELPVIVLLVIVLVFIVIFSPSNIPRIVLGLPFVLFLPGYTLLAALYVRKDRLKGLERLALSFGMSAAIGPLIGLFLNYTWGISLASFFVMIALFELVTCLIAWIRRGRVPPAERFTIRMSRRRPSIGWHKAPAIVLGLAALVMVGSLAYVIVVPKTHEDFTEFYIAGLQDKSVYPVALVAGVAQKMGVTIVNRERRTLTYLIETKINGQQQSRTGPFRLEYGQKYEGEIAFTPEAPGARQLVEFVLYLEGEPEPYLQPLRLWVDVTSD